MNTLSIQALHDGVDSSNRSMNDASSTNLSSRMGPHGQPPGPRGCLRPHDTPGVGQRHSQNCCRIFRNGASQRPLSRMTNMKFRENGTLLSPLARSVFFKMYHCIGTRCVYAVGQTVCL